MSRRSIRLTHRPFILSAIIFHWQMLCSHPRNMVRFSLRVQSHRRLSRLTQSAHCYWHRFIQAPIKRKINAPVFLLISHIWKIHGYSACACYISEELPLEACPVILGELLWRHVMSIGNEEGIAVATRQLQFRANKQQTQEEPQIRSISLVFVMQMQKLHFVRNQRWASSFLMKDGFLKSDIKADRCIQPPK